MTGQAMTDALKLSTDGIRAWAKRNTYPLIVSSVGFLLLTVFLLERIFVNVPPGHIGILWERLFGGTVTERTFGEGLNIILPFNRMYTYDTRIQQVTDTYGAISSDGLMMNVEMSVRFRLVERNVGYLHKFVGPDYIGKLVVPEASSQMRSIISNYTPEDLYSRKRQKIQKEIFDLVQRELETVYDPDLPSRRFVLLEAVLIRDVVIPARVKEAIESKIEQFHKMLEYDYRIQREAKEGIRKHMEAEGIRKFQEVVSKGITPDLLTWKGIEASLALARSNNAKVVVIGSGRNGLPVILNAETMSPPAAAPSGEPHPQPDAEDVQSRAEDLDILRGVTPASPAPAKEVSKVVRAPLPMTPASGLPKALERAVDSLTQPAIGQDAPKK
jgi:prohibitin 2